LHLAHGVDLRTGTMIASVERAGPSADAPITALVLDDGTRLPCDAVLAGIGMVPNTELARDAGLRVEQGIVVDNLSRTSDPDIVAAGDCTAQDLGNGLLRRLESVPNALEQARAAASWLCGKPKPNLSVPWFWSDQYGVKLQMVGLTAGCDATVQRGAATDQSFTLFYLCEGRVVAAAAINRPAEFMQAKRLVASGAVVDPQQLADESVPLKDLGVAGAQ
jgi:3-phenylpropionate/trans-cinnamate dioxygenase ferredoxin reductase subunit